MAVPAKSTPRDAQVMMAILKDIGIADYEPRLINQMLEFAYRYITDVLDDAKVYSNYANKKNIDAEDVRLAVHCRMDQSFTTPPPKDMLMEIARQKNSQALPLIKPYSVPRLPPDRNCLTATNFKLVSARSIKKQQQKTQHSRIQIGLQGSQLSSGSMPSQRISLTPFQQSIASKVAVSGGNHALTVVTKGMSRPTVTIVNAPKPTVRYTPGQTLSSSSTGTLPSTSIFSQSMLTENTATAATLPTSMVQSTVLLSNPLKRKLEDDDYDKP